MDELIKAVNDLQDAFSSLDSKFVLDLPQIAVVGSQSAGKSSVLENIVGKDFLPRGTGIVTRRPLILQLIRNPSGEEYGEFLHLQRQKKFYDFNEIREEIQRETYRICGDNKGVSWSPINLRIYSPHVLDLTLIDLPGMTKVPVGDQPPDIEIQIRDLIYQYVENPNCLVLAVNPANSDLANSDALKLAQNVDPSGSRTIGVLTKLDLMDEGTDARAVLINEVIPLKYGYVGVVNRSQRDIETNKDINIALEAERRFFLGEPAYKDIADQQGTSYLQKSLNYHLIRHIAETLPGLRAKLQKRVLEIEKELATFALDINYEEPYWKMKTMLMNLMVFSENFRTQLLGQTDVGLNVTQLSSGAKIEHFFNAKYPAMLKTIEFTDEALMKKQIGFAILNNIGPRVAIFTPDKAFDQIVRNQISKLKEPSMDLLDMTAAEILKVLDKSLEINTGFPRLTKAIESRVNVYVMQQVESARNQILDFINCETAYINAKHEDFVGFTYAEYVASRRVLARRNPATETIKSGYLNITNLSVLRDKRFWFVLTPESLSLYTDESRLECKFIVALDDYFMINDMQKSYKFALYHTRNRQVYKEHSRLEFNAATQDELDSWKRSFARVGIFGDSVSPTDPSVYALFSGSVSKEILGDTNDPNLERQIETIWVLVESYMQIVLNTLKRMVPKIVAFALIKDIVGFLDKKFVAEFPRTVDMDEVMEENEIQKERRQMLTKSLQACKIALEKLSHVHLPRSDIKVYSAEKLAKVGHRRVDLVPPPQQPPMRPARPAKAASSRASLVIGQQQSFDATSTLVVAKREDAPVAADSSTVRKKSSIFNRNSLQGGSSRNLNNKMEKARQQIDPGEKSMFYVM